MSPKSSPAVDTRPVMYVLKRFPRLSETFVLHEILGLEAAGVRVLVDSLMPAETGPSHAELADLQAVVREVAAHPRWARKAVWQAHLAVAARHPLRWVGIAAAARRQGNWRQFLQAGLVADRIRRDDARHVHAHFATTATVVAAMAARLAGITCSVTAHAKDIHHRDNASRLGERLDGVDVLVTVSAANVAHLREVLPPRMRARVQLIHNGVPVGLLARPDRSTSVLCVARLVPKKGLDVLLRSTALLVQRYPSLKVLVIGTGPLLADLVALRAELGLQHTVEFFGAATSSEVSGAMNSARVVALACRIDEFGDRDGMPTVLVEALARGVPVVSTDVPGVAELVRDRITGLVVPPDDVAAFAGGLGELLSDPALARRMGLAGRDLVASDFAPAESVRRLIDVFATSAGGNR